MDFEEGQKKLAELKEFKGTAGKAYVMTADLTNARLVGLIKAAEDSKCSTDDAMEKRRLASKAKLHQRVKTAMMIPESKWGAEEFKAHLSYWKKDNRDKATTKLKDHELKPEWDRRKKRLDFRPEMLMTDAEIEAALMDVPPSPHSKRSKMNKKDEIDKCNPSGSTKPKPQFYNTTKGCI